MLYEFFVKAISLSNDEQEKFLQEVKVNHADIYQELLEMLADDQTSKEHATQYWGELISEHSSQILKPERSLVGETFGVFTLTELIANGGMGSVYKANRSDGQFEQVVAIKVIYSALEEVIGEQALIREAGFMAKLTHPNIGKVFDAGLSKHGMRFIVMEFIEGVTIDQYFQDKQISLKQKLTQIGRASCRERVCMFV